MLGITAIGLQYRFSSFQWVSTVPPILFVLAYKIYINRTFLPRFTYFIPTEEDLRQAKVHSERGDIRGHRLEKRFGHPALHMELFTPMLHAKMMPLLSQVYTGKINNDKAKLDEYGGQKVDAQIVPGGIRIAGISQHDLEYDPALYRRDRGELDWDQRSIASTALVDGASMLESSKSQFYANSSTAKLVGYDSYLSKGPGGYQNPSDIEMTPIEEPLLSARALQYQQHLPSQQTLVSDSPPTSYQRFNAAPLEAPLHRPQSRAYSPSPSYHTDPNSHAPRSTPTPTPGQHVSQHSQQWSASGHGHSGRQLSQTINNMVGVGAGVGAVRHQQSASQQWGNVSRSGTPVQGQPQWGNASRPGTPLQGAAPYPVQHPPQQWQQQQPDRQGNSNNLAGRGAYRGY
jgi:hypothetical protein